MGCCLCVKWFLNFKVELLFVGKGLMLGVEFSSFNISVFIFLQGGSVFGLINPVQFLRLSEMIF